MNYVHLKVNYFITKLNICIHHGCHVPIDHGCHVPINHGCHVPINHGCHVPIDHGCQMNKVILQITNPP